MPLFNPTSGGLLHSILHQQNRDGNRETNRDTQDTQDMQDADPLSILTSHHDTDSIWCEDEDEYANLHTPVVNLANRTNSRKRRRLEQDLQDEYDAIASTMPVLSTQKQPYRQRRQPRSLSDFWDHTEHNSMLKLDFSKCMPLQELFAIFKEVNLLEMTLPLLEDCLSPNPNSRPDAMMLESAISMDKQAV
jgi:hypothetical protein